MVDECYLAVIAEELDFVRRGLVPPCWEVGDADGLPLVRELTSGSPTESVVREAFEASFFNACPDSEPDLRGFIESGVRAAWRALTAAPSGASLFD